MVLIVVFMVLSPLAHIQQFFLPEFPKSYHNYIKMVTLLQVIRTAFPPKFAFFVCFSTILSKPQVLTSTAELWSRVLFSVLSPDHPETVFLFFFNPTKEVVLYENWLLSAAARHPG
ncbi:MAG: hypothetical protein HFG24_03270 [Anaerotruncus sp.]|nr:hypothetical protein [Anaerotruncus sp.]